MRERSSPRLKSIVAVILLMGTGAFIYISLEDMGFGDNNIHTGEGENETVGGKYNSDSLNDTGSTNVVTGIVVNYRGFDTLGEVTVLFIAATGVGGILYTSKKNRHISKVESSLIVKTGARLLFPFILILGAYIFIHGHLTPGGGFQGGAVIASAFLLMLLTDCNCKFDHKKFSISESLSGLTFLSIGFLGLYLTGSFLANFLPAGSPRELFSAGIIPIVYIAVGIKVGAELTGVVENMIKGGVSE